MSASRREFSGCALRTSCRIGGGTVISARISQDPHLPESPPGPSTATRYSAASGTIETPSLLDEILQSSAQFFFEQSPPTLLNPRSVAPRKAKRLAHVRDIAADGIHASVSRCVADQRWLRIPFKFATGAAHLSLCGFGENSPRTRILFFTF